MFRQSLQILFVSVAAREASNFENSSFKIESWLLAKHSDFISSTQYDNIMVWMRRLMRGRQVLYTPGVYRKYWFTLLAPRKQSKLRTCPCRCRCPLFFCFGLLHHQGYFLDLGTFPDTDIVDASTTYGNIPPAIPKDSGLEAWTGARACALV